MVNFSAVNPKKGVQKSVTAVQKSVTTEGPIGFQTGKRECKFFQQNKQTWRVKFENNNCDQIWLIFYRIGVIKIKYRKIGKFCLLHIYLSRGYGRKLKFFLSFKFLMEKGKRSDRDVSTVGLRVFLSQTFTFILLQVIV